MSISIRLISFVIFASFVFTAAGDAAAAFATLYSFRADGTGEHPWTGILRTQSGGVLGTTSGGGKGFGVVYRLDPPATAEGPWRYKVLHNFLGGRDGTFPLSSLVAGASGRLYGTTESGGGGSCSGGCGTVFELIPNSVGGYIYQVIHRFGPAKSGARPSGQLSFRSGRLYGTTSIGGTFDGGTVYVLQRVGDLWQKSVLHNFQGGANDGKYPRSGVVAGRDGALYGTTETGGMDVGGLGTVFRLAPGAAAGSQVKLLHRFQGGDDGSGPLAPVVIDAKGNVYGTTPYGGVGPCPLQCGTVFRLAKNGGVWVKTTIYRFGRDGDGSFPRGSLVLDAQGRLFGTASGGGLPVSAGTVWRLDPPLSSPGPWRRTVLHRFSGPPADGAAPFSGLRFAGRWLWGTTRDGGANSSAGTIFRFVP